MFHVALAFGGVALLGLIGFVVAWRLGKKKNDPMRLYLLGTSDGLILAEIEKTDPSDPFLVGAVVPGVDGNYYVQLLVWATRKDGDLEFTEGAEGWLERLKTRHLPSGKAIISDEFLFDPADVRVVEFQAR